jgi:hypothetical protein
VSTLPPTSSPISTLAGGAHEPAWVRRGSKQVQQDYQVALEFEQVLVQQLTSSMAQAGGFGEGASEGESEEGGAALGPLSSMLPQTLASGITNSGGLGLAAQLTRAEARLQGAIHAPGAGAATGTGAATSTGGVTASGGVAAGGEPAANGSAPGSPVQASGGSAAPEGGAGR